MSTLFGRLWRLMAIICGVYALFSMVIEDWSGAFSVAIAGVCFMLIEHHGKDNDEDDFLN